MSIVGLSPEARADLPRPPGWEPTCTLEKEQAKGGGPCDHCRGWQDPDPCQKALEDKGYTRRCTEGGAGSFVAVWCKSAANLPGPASDPASTTTNPANPPPQVAPASDNRRGSGICSVASVGHDKPNSALWILGLLTAGLGLVRRRAS